MKRPLAYITAAWGSCEYTNTKVAAAYCRVVYEAGFSPICPILSQSLYLNSAIPAEHKSGKDMGRELLRRSRVLVVCGDRINEDVKSDIAIAQRYRIAATTLDGIMTIMEHGAVGDYWQLTLD